MLLTVLLDTSATAVAKFKDFRAMLVPFTAGAYGNFLSTADKEDVAAIYPPETYARLSAIKHKYDPANLFDQNYNVKPSPDIH